MSSETPPSITPASITSGPVRLHVLHVLRIGGLASGHAVAEFAGLPEDVVNEQLAAAVAVGHAVERSGRMPGHLLTPAGRAWHADALAAELDQLDGRAAVERADERFVALNGPFKQLCTDWQLRGGGPNDHRDAEYDAEVIVRLGGIHEAVTAATATAATAVPRFGWHPRRFDSAWRRLRNGELRAFVAPMADSYHDAWMALHQDLLSSLGRERSAADGH